MEFHIPREIEVFFIWTNLQASSLLRHPFQMEKSTTFGDSNVFSEERDNVMNEDTDEEDETYEVDLKDFGSIPPGKKRTLKSKV
ncbi:hypothetical protein PanWU01x14_219600 [Parasponia andersonii]|uniref:Uncharacterized protein n=1 Tax=Parasponia andersonii TaxID=3476 RepID=A0A2P5BQ67_PARAD|nr:hypothetical protein PanWU01x14_219600 [Parasponia andersonii]